MLGTSALMVMLPLMLEVDREQMIVEELAEQRRRREMFQAMQAQQVSLTDPHKKQYINLSS